MVTVYKSMFVFVALAAFVLPAVNQNLAGVKCVVDGQNNATDAWSTNWHEGRIYFSSHGSFASFNVDPQKYELKANHQLVVTGQYAQTACPCCGEAIDVNDESLAMSVAGVKIRFHSDQCRATIESRGQLIDRAEVVYGKENFERNFSVSGN